MSGNVKLAVYLVAGVFALFFAVKIIGILLAKVLSILIPLVFAAAVIYAVIYVVNRKALGSGGRRILP